MKVLSKVAKSQFEIKGDKLYIRYSEGQLSSFSDELPAYQPDIETIEEETNYSYQQIVVPVNSSRDHIIASIINDRYSRNDQIALLANKDDEVTIHQQEYQQFQIFRNFTKKLITEVI